MKKILFAVIACLVLMATACQNKNKEAAKNEALIRQRVEQMIQMNDYYDADKLLTSELYALQTKAQDVHFWAVFFPGFQWDLGVMDACSEKQEVNIEGIKQIDSMHCDVAMRYIDEGCYDDPYTLKLLKENGEWRIDDVIYNEGDNSLRDDCKLFYESVADEYRTASTDEVMEFLMQEEPLEENYTDPECIYYNNPDAIWQLIDEIKCCRELFKENPNYTQEMGQQIDEMLERIASHL